MKMIIFKAGCVIGGLGAIGYMYLNKHPDCIKNIKNDIKDVSDKVSKLMEE